MNIALYCLGGSDIFGQRSDSLHFIDPYQATNKDWELEVARTNGQSRVVLHELETQSAFISMAELRRALRYANEDTLELLRRSLHKSRWRPNNDEVCKARFMAQRTRMGCVNNIDLEFYILEACRFWRAYMKVFSIDIVVSRIVPHSLTDYLMALAARGLGKPFVCQLPLPTKGCSALLELGEGEFLKKEIGDWEYKDAIDEMIENSRRKKNGIREAYPMSIRVDSNKTFDDYKKYLVSGGVCASRILEEKFRLVTQYDRAARMKPMPMRWTKAHLFFLQYQPEATSCPLGGYYYDQRVAIQKVYRELDSDEILLVREHPIQFFFCGIEDTWEQHLENILSHRSEYFYDYCYLLDNTYFVPRSFSLDELMAVGDIKVWSLTGTVQLEAYLRGLDVGHIETNSVYADLVKRQELGLEERSRVARIYFEERTWRTVSTESSRHEISNFINTAVLLVN